MGRTNIYRYDDYEGKTLDSWFYPEKSERFDEDTRWDGNNQVSLVTGDQFEHETLYRTGKGRWVLHHWSQWQGREETYQYISDDKAREWLLTCNHDKAVETYFGELEEEGPGPGRPSVGPQINIRLGDDLTARVDAVKRQGESRAAVIRRLLEHALDTLDAE